ncbi:excinuclease ABC subunit UvrA [Acidiferrimicrobium sp. IK]|uniref:excinuclease ABC subunit UvrA n=1 Tax=Acidiferrimicrobium sp. IK TaxID=2871700 RepID=UPI0021CB911B|nr:excinuclease ABC subunit UvrA [Acidiferrimicrobium sp. IK]MCU4183544.1 excinuclease ABC subunit UvrA [Acidiferrimicrobium sp. IK]
MSETLVVRGAREHNLRNVSIELPRDKLIVFTGLSGSGKSSLAFDTIYAEGQRRYVESLSSYARQFLGQMDKPDVDFIEGLSPAISIDQKSASRNPRSTVGTITEIYDYLRLLYARVGVPHCPRDGTVVQRQTPQQIVDRILELPDGTRFQVLAPVVRGRKGEYQSLLEELAGQGYARARIDGEVYELSDPPKLARYEVHTIEVVVDRLVRRDGIERRLTDSLETALGLAEGVAEVQLVPRSAEGSGRDAAGGEAAADTEEILTFSQHLACPTCGLSFDEPAPRNFSFNSPYGACANCDGLGTRFEVDPELVVPDPDASIEGGAIAAWGGARGEYFARVLASVAETYGFSTDTPWRELKKSEQKVLLYGSGTKQIHVQYRNRYGRTRSYHTQYEGVVPYLQRRHTEAESDHLRETIEGYMREVPCPTCAGARLKPESLAVTVAGHNIFDLCDLSLRDATRIMGGLELTERDHLIADRVLKEIQARMQFLLDVGLDYLSLNRSAATLAGGEAQRIRLASQIGSGLVGVLYVLDEPSIGLHQRDNRKLIDTLLRLRDLGNTVIVVEHNEDTIRVADYVVDIGPGAGEHGGNVVVAGPVSKLLKSRQSITGQYLTGRRKIPVPAVRREPKGYLTVRGAREHNLKGIDVEFPLGCLVAVTGVSGSGKSTLVNDILLRSLMQRIYKSKDVPGRHRRIEGAEQLDKVISIDQSPIGRTPRSNPATYTGVFDHIRRLFSTTTEAKVRGYQPGRFSFNVKGGRCEACAGDGTIKIEMHFLPDVYVPCEVCKGARYNRDTLDIQFKGKNISEVLDMPCEEALGFFANQPVIARHMQTLVDVGLGYVRLGQPAPTLSGGEAQRIKLASELAKRSTGHTAYVLDEPTTGLHFEDIRKLLTVLSRLVDQGNSVLVIEHNLDVIKTADWIIDMGPEGGDGGGTVIVEGTPETVAKTRDSYTGQFLVPLLGMD